MGLTITIIVVIVLVVAALAALALVMSRAKELSPHEPQGRRFARRRKRARGNSPGPAR